jgi:hypothetical protein
MGFFYHHCSLENWSGLAVRCKKKKVKKRFPVYVLSLALVLFLKKKKLGFLSLFADNN